MEEIKEKMLMLENCYEAIKHKLSQDDIDEIEWRSEKIRKTIYILDEGKYQNDDEKLSQIAFIKHHQNIVYEILKKGE